MAWCHQATSHCLSQCWPRSLSPYDIARPQWVKIHLNCYYSYFICWCLFLLDHRIFLHSFICISVCYFITYQPCALCSLHEWIGVGEAAKFLVGIINKGKSCCISHSVILRVFRHSKSLLFPTVSDKRNWRARFDELLCWCYSCDWPQIRDPQSYNSCSAVGEPSAGCPSCVNAARPECRHQWDNIWHNQSVQLSLQRAWWASNTDNREGPPTQHQCHRPQQPQVSSAGVTFQMPSHSDWSSVWYVVLVCPSILFIW